MEDTSLFICACGDVSHQMIISKDEDPKDNYRQCFVSVHLNKLSFWERLKVGIKYIFGHQSKFGAFDELILTKDHAQDILNIGNFLNGN